MKESEKINEKVLNGVQVTANTLSRRSGSAEGLTIWEMRPFFQSSARVSTAIFDGTKRFLGDARALRLKHDFPTLRRREGQDSWKKRWGESEKGSERGG